MTNYKVVFLLDGVREFEPMLKIGDRNITYITDLSDYAREELRVEMGAELFERLWSTSRISCIEIDTNAEDEQSAIKNAWINAKQITNALSLVEFDKQNAISIAYNHSPNIIPNVLITNMDEDTPALRFGHYTPPGLMLLNLAELGVQSRDFNETVIRHMEKLMPPEIWYSRDFENDLMKRLIHSLNWYSIAMNQQEKEFRFIALWFALESLVLESFKTSDKRRKVVNRLPKLFARHNSEEINQNHIVELWQLRTEIVHEARSGFMADRNGLISANNINLTKYFYLLTVLFILDTLGEDYSIQQAWQKLSQYTPSINIIYGKMPKYVDYMGMFRSR